MTFLFGFVLGCMLGASLGVFVIALMLVGPYADRYVTASDPTPPPAPVQPRILLLHVRRPSLN